MLLAVPNQLIAATIAEVAGTTAFEANLAATIAVEREPIGGIVSLFFAYGVAMAFARASLPSFYIAIVFFPCFRADAMIPTVSRDHRLKIGRLILDDFRVVKQCSSQLRREHFAGR